MLNLHLLLWEPGCWMVWCMVNAAALCCHLCHCSAERSLHFDGNTVEMFLTLEIAKVKSFSYLQPLTGVDPRISRTLTRRLTNEVQTHAKSCEMYNYILIDHSKLYYFKYEKVRCTPGIHFRPFIFIFSQFKMWNRLTLYQGLIPGCIAP